MYTTKVSHVNILRNRYVALQKLVVKVPYFLDNLLYLVSSLEITSMSHRQETFLTLFVELESKI